MTTRQIARTWSSRGVQICTIHPTYGELFRGRITQRHTEPGQTCGRWHVQDQDGCEVGVVAGDYIDAERALLEATDWADESA